MKGLLLVIYELRRYRSLYLKTPLLGSFFADFIKGDFENVFCDLGATSSDQFQKFFKMEGSKRVLKKLEKAGVTIKLFVVVAGENAFKPSFEFAEKIVDAFDSQKVVILKNRLYTYSNKEIAALESLKKGKENVFISEFGIGEKGVKNEMLEMTRECMAEGKSVMDSDDFMLPVQFEFALEEIEEII